LEASSTCKSFPGNHCSGLCQKMLFVYIHMYVCTRYPNGLC
jgi:hypothetical protein